MHKRLLAIIQKKQKTGKVRLNEFWAQLADGEEHDLTSVANAIGYSNVASKGFKDAIATLDELGFLNVKKGKTKKTLQLKGFLFPITQHVTEQQYKELSSEELVDNVIAI